MQQHMKIDLLRLLRFPIGAILLIIIQIDNIVILAGVVMTMMTYKVLLKKFSLRK